LRKRIEITGFAISCYLRQGAAKENLVLIMNVSLTPELEKFVTKEVDSGLYQTASEVVRAGLRRLKEDREMRALRAPATREELEAQLIAAADSLEAGRGVDGEAAFRRLRKRIKEARG
jgi:antitoxin ParD1/3/4